MCFQNQMTVWKQNQTILLIVEMINKLKRCTNNNKFPKISKTAHRWKSIYKNKKLTQFRKNQIQ